MEPGAFQNLDEEVGASEAIWVTWETQRRNSELAEAFNCRYVKLDYSGRHRLVRYCICTFLTVRELLRFRPKIVYAQCPSVILVALLAALKPLFGYRLVIDAHNATFFKETWTQAALNSIVRLAFMQSDFVIISNAGLRGEVLEMGGVPTVLPDRLPHLADGVLPPALAATGKVRIVLVSSFHGDEPIREFLEAASAVKLDFTLFVTGSKSRAGDLLEFESERIRFTGFLPQIEFDSLLRGADLIVDLTTLEDCLVCGAYEAVAAGVPLILSDNKVMRELFSQGTILTANTPAAYQHALREFFPRQKPLKQEMLEFRDEYRTFWELRFAQVCDEIKRRSPGVQTSGFSRRTSVISTPS